MDENINPMKQIKIEKVTVNMGVGQSGDEMKRAQKIMEKITGTKAVQTKCKVKQPKWEIRPGLPIGLKTTLRGQDAKDLLKRTLEAKDNTLLKKNFDLQGNFAFGIHEYIDIPGIKYDPTLGIRGLDVVITLTKPGYRVKKRKIRKKSVGKKHMIRKEDAIAFVKDQFGVVVE